MNTKFLFLSLFTTSLLFAQANRFVYQVTMKTDSTDRNVSKTETAILDISGGKSIFYSENRVKRDSIISKARQNGSFNFDRTQLQDLRSNMNYIIEKNLINGNKIYKSRILRDDYAYEEDRPMNWKILPETATIGDYKTQKAETDFGGRKWNVWFTTEIPFQDGPYKFSGLPGLIVKAEDSKGDYSFDLKETKKIKESATFEQRGPTINVKRVVFEKQQEQFEKDPAAAISSLANQNPRFKMDADQRKKREERRATESKSNNNPIELK